MTLIAHESLGTCLHCKEAVILIFHGVDGFRYCLGCERTGPDVVLTAEAKAEAEEDFFDADDFTQISATPWELLQAARRG
jgi:hypothetical protein